MVEWIKYDVAEVKQYRIEHECSLQQAIRDIKRKRMKEILDSAQSIDDLKPVILELMEKF